MNALAPKLRELIAAHVAQASPEEIAQLVGSLCGRPGNGTSAAVRSLGREYVSIEGPRFIMIGADGRPLDSNDEPHVAVYDGLRDLTWSRTNVGSERMNWKDADAACRSLNLAGHQDWRLPTIQELLSIVDYERKEPAIDTALFDCEPSWYWTSTPAAASPADCAWFVYFGDGLSNWNSRGADCYVRAVRPGQ